MLPGIRLSFGLANPAMVDSLHLVCFPFDFLCQIGGDAALNSMLFSNSNVACLILFTILILLILINFARTFFCFLMLSNDRSLIDSYFIFTYLWFLQSLRYFLLTWIQWTTLRFIKLALLGFYNLHIVVWLFRILLFFCDRRSIRCWFCSRQAQIISLDAIINDVFSWVWKWIGWLISLLRLYRLGGLLWVDNRYNFGESFPIVLEFGLIP